jgi:parvulin-like peptidyl-prolyl isomerase
VPEFATTVMSLQPGEISQPARANFGTNFGWHIVWLRERTAAHAMTVETDYERVAQVALYLKRNRLNAEWVEELKRTIYLDIRL